MAGFTYGDAQGAQYGGEDGGLLGLPLIFPPLDLTVSNVTKTAADLSWTDNNPDEYAVGVQRAKYYEDIEKWGPWREIDVLEPNAESYTDDSAQPGRRYRWRVYASNAAGRSFSNEDNATTVASDARQTNINTRGWYVEIDHPDAAAPIKPQVLAEPIKKPTSNGLPRVEIPVERDERWQSDGFTEADMRVWVDGKRTPIDTLVDVRMEPGQTTLIGRGGSELLNKVEHEVTFAEAHSEAETLIDDNTGYTTVVDDPVSDLDENVSLLLADDESAFQANLPEFDDDVPVRIAGDGTVQTKPTAWFAEAEDHYGTGTVNAESNSDRWSGNQTVQWDTGGGSTLDVEVTFEVDHEIPANDAVFDARIQFAGEGHDGLSLWIDGTLVEKYQADSLPTGETEPGWLNPLSYDQPLSPGEHTVRLWYSGNDTPLSDGETGDDYLSDFEDTRIYADCVVLCDERYNPGLTETVTDGVLEGPDLHPTDVSIATDNVTTPFSVVGGRIEAIVDQGTLPQLELSNDQGSTWPIADTDTNTLEGDFAEASPQLQARISLGGYDDDPNVSPAGRKTSQSLQAYELFADLDDTPTIANKTYNAQLVDVLRQIAEDRNFVFDVRWDSANETMAVHWTQLGQRYDDSNPDVADYQVNKTTADLVEQLQVFGSSQRRTGEEITLNIGTSEPLEHTDLVDLKEAVVSTDGDQYARGEDYEISYLDGTITATETGAISDGETVEVDYEYKTQGTWPSDDEAPDNPREDTERIMGLGTSRICEQTAYYIVKRTNTPVWEGTITLPKQETGWSVIDEINPDAVPTTGNRLEIVSSDESPSKLVFDIRSRRSVDEIVQDLSSGIESVKEVS